jgi:hypothetical protein
MYFNYYIIQKIKILNLYIDDVTKVLDKVTNK